MLPEKIPTTFCSATKKSAIDDLFRAITANITIPPAPVRAYPKPPFSSPLLQDALRSTYHKRPLRLAIETMELRSTAIQAPFITHIADGGPRSVISRYPSPPPAPEWFRFGPIAPPVAPLASVPDIALSPAASTPAMASAILRCTSLPADVGVLVVYSYQLLGRCMLSSRCQLLYAVRRSLSKSAVLVVSFRNMEQKHCGVVRLCSLKNTKNHHVCRYLPTNRRYIAAHH